MRMTRKRTYAMIAAVTVVGAVVGTGGALVSAHLHFGSGHQTTGGQYIDVGLARVKE